MISKIGKTHFDSVLYREQRWIYVFVMCSQYHQGWVGLCHVVLLVVHLINFSVTDTANGAYDPNTYGLE